MPEKEIFIPKNEFDNFNLDPVEKAEAGERNNESKTEYFQSLESQARERRDARSEKLKEWADELDSTFPGHGLKELLAKNPLIREELLDANIPKDILPLIEKFFQKKNGIGDEMNKELDRINQEKLKHMEKSVEQI